MFTDTHCHIFSEYYDDIKKVVDEANKNGISKIINNATSKESVLEILEISKKYPNIYSAIGIHPEEANNYIQTDLNYIEENINNCIAIGEIGLDYHYVDFDKEKQIKLLEAQLKLAEKYQKPVIIHSRDATEDTINTLKKYPTVKGVIHCFTGSLELAQIYSKMGYKLGLNGVITFKNSKFYKVLENIPLEMILLETDAPFLTPEPLRGQRNHPKNIIFIAEYIAKMKGITLETLAAITEKNIHEIFDI